MADIAQTTSQLQAAFADNLTGNITAQDGRNLILSAMGVVLNRSPSINDDNVDSNETGNYFDAGSTWIDTNTAEIWFCYQGSAGEADWRPLCCNVWKKGGLIYADKPSTVPLEIIGATGQTSNLLEFVSGSGSLLSYFDPNGNLVLGANDATLTGPVILIEPNAGSTPYTPIIELGHSEYVLFGWNTSGGAYIPGNPYFWIGDPANNSDNLMQFDLANASYAACQEYLRFDTIGWEIVAQHTAPTQDFLQTRYGTSVIRNRLTINGEFVGMGFAGNVRAVSVATTLVLTDDLVLMNAASAPLAANLPAASSTAIGRRFTVKKIDSSGNAVTVTPHGTDTIDNAGSQALSAQNQWLTVQSDGVSNWNIVSKTGSGSGNPTGNSILDLTTYTYTVQATGTGTPTTGGVGVEYQTQGTETIDAPLEICGVQLWCCCSVPQWKAANYPGLVINDWYVSTPGTLYLVSVDSPNMVLTGMAPWNAAGVSGPQVMGLINVGTIPFLIEDGNPNSKANNRITMPDAQTRTMAPGDLSLWWYDVCTLASTGTGKWRMLGGSGQVTRYTPFEQQGLLPSSANITTSTATITSVQVPQAGTYQITGSLLAQANGSGSGQIVVRAWLAINGTAIEGTGMYPFWNDFMNTSTLPASKAVTATTLQTLNASDTIQLNAVVTQPVTGIGVIAVSDAYHPTNITATRLA